MIRESWDKYFLDIAETVSTRSTCVRRNVGAVAVKDKRILATGYNGAPSGIEHCTNVSCLRQQMGIPSGEQLSICKALHAEQNVIIQAGLCGVSLKESTFYITCTPCTMCAKMLINSRITAIVCKEYYPDEFASKMLSQVGIKVFVLNEDSNRQEVFREE